MNDLVIFYHEVLIAPDNRAALRIELLIVQASGLSIKLKLCFEWTGYINHIMRFLVI